ncbi:hypothetical protein CB1_001536006 [Camelus ferus]|nr:hypothetical protein CB1_001536006 [Camelus ferus]
MAPPSTQIFESRREKTERSAPAWEEKAEWKGSEMRVSLPVRNASGLRPSDAYRQGRREEGSAQKTGRTSWEEQDDDLELGESTPYLINVSDTYQLPDFNHLYQCRFCHSYLEAQYLDQYDYSDGLATSGFSAPSIFPTRTRLLLSKPRIPGTGAEKGDAEGRTRRREKALLRRKRSAVAARCLRALGRSPAEFGPGPRDSDLEMALHPPETLRGGALSTPAAARDFRVTPWRGEAVGLKTPPAV